jgi:hypothetical protein
LRLLEIHAAEQHRELLLTQQILTLPIPEWEAAAAAAENYSGDIEAFLDVWDAIIRTPPGDNGNEHP